MLVSIAQPAAAAAATHAADPARGLAARLGVVWTLSQTTAVVARDPGTDFDAIADGPAVDLLADVAAFLSELAEGLAHRDQCAALAAEGHETPPLPPGTRTGDELDAMLAVARTAVAAHRAIDLGRAA